MDNLNINALKWWLDILCCFFHLKQDAQIKAINYFSVQRNPYCYPRLEAKFHDIHDILKDISDKNSPKRVKIENEIYESDKFIKDSFTHDLKTEEEKAIKAIKKNNKFFYSYAKKKSKTKVTIGPFMHNNNKVINDPHTMGDMLKTQYTSVQSKPKSEKIVLNPISFFKTDNDFTLNDINFNQNDVKKVMLEVSATAAPSPDYFPALLLNKCADTLSTPIYIIWRKSLDLGKIPSLTKDALVSPVHKGDSRALPKNYRPISLTSHIIKVQKNV